MLLLFGSCLVQLWSGWTGAVIQEVHLLALPQFVKIGSMGKMLTRMCLYGYPSTIAKGMDSICIVMGSNTVCTMASTLACIIMYKVLYNLEYYYYYYHLQVTFRGGTIVQDPG